MYPSSQSWLSASGMRGDLYNDWSAAGLAMSDNAKLQAIADGICQAYNVGLEDVHQVHVFSDSANTLRLTMDVSHHSGQHLSLPICKVLVPWLQHHPNNSIHFHHITAGVELEDHQLVHILATSTRAKTGRRQLYLLTLPDVERSHKCSRAGTHCSSPKSISDQTS
jgi:hypothetical protein